MEGWVGEGNTILGWKCNCVCFWLFRTAVHLRNRQLLHTTFKLFMTSLLFQVYMLLWNASMKLLTAYKKVLFEILQSTDSFNGKFFRWPPPPLTVCKSLAPYFFWKGINLTNIPFLLNAILNSCIDAIFKKKLCVFFPMEFAFYLSYRHNV